MTLKTWPPPLADGMMIFFFFTGLTSDKTGGSEWNLYSAFTFSTLSTNIRIGADLTLLYSATSPIAKLHWTTDSQRKFNHVVAACSPADQNKANWTLLQTKDTETKKDKKNSLSAAVTTSSMHERTSWSPLLSRATEKIKLNRDWKGKMELLTALCSKHTKIWHRWRQQDEDGKENIQGSMDKTGTNTTSVCYSQKTLWTSPLGLTDPQVGLNKSQEKSLSLSSPAHLAIPVNCNSAPISLFSTSAPKNLLKQTQTDQESKGWICFKFMSQVPLNNLSWSLLALCVSSLYHAALQVKSIKLHQLCKILHFTFSSDFCMHLHW